MSAKDDGGQAFPGRNFLGVPVPGMTLRDWFAGQALSLTTFVCDEASIEGESACDPARHATQAYAIADAMLVARLCSTTDPTTQSTPAAEEGESR